MKLREFVIFTLVFCILIIQGSATDQYLEENDDQYRQLKGFFFHKNPTTTASNLPDVTDNLIRPSSTRSPSIWNHCRPNICNTGRCISLKTTYYCQCSGDLYGEHCEKRLHKRNLSNRRSYYQLLNQLKRELRKQDNSDENDNNGRAYYDFKNGLYF